MPTAVVPRAVLPTSTVQTTVTGLISDPGGNPATGGTVTFVLSPSSSAIAFRVAGTSLFAPRAVVCQISPTGQLLNEAGTGPCLIWGNPAILPGNTTYTMLIAPTVNGSPLTTSTIYGVLIFGATYDLSNIQFAPNVEVTPQQTVLRADPVEANLVPVTGHVFNLGSQQLPYANIFADNLTLSDGSLLDADNIQADNIAADNITTSNLAATNIATSKISATTYVGLPPFSSPLVTNVKDFGAKGDGATNDTAALNSAYTSVAANKGILFFPAGNYVTTGSLAPLEGVIFQGAGIQSTQILYQGTGFWLDLGPTVSANYFTLRDMQITCQSPAIGAIRVGSPSQDYSGSIHRLQWNFSNLYIFGPGQTVVGTIGVSLTMLNQHTISNFTVVQFERIAIIDRCQNGAWTRARFLSFTFGPLISSKAGSGTIIPGGGSQDTFINPEFLGPYAGPTTGGDTVTVATNVTFINALYEVAAGFQSTALLHLVSPDPAGGVGAAPDFVDINGGFSGPNALKTIIFDNNYSAPKFIGTVVGIGGFGPIQFGTPASPVNDDPTAKFINCSFQLNKLVQAADSTGKFATIFGGPSSAVGTAAGAGVVVNQSQVCDQTGILRVVGVAGYNSGGATSGRGINFRYFDPLTTDQGLIQCYDNTNNVFKILAISAALLQLEASGTPILTVGSNGMQLSGGVQAAASNPGMQHQLITTPSIPASSSTNVSVTWNTPFADTNYSVVAAVLEGTSASSLRVVKIAGIAANLVSVQVANDDTVAHTGQLMVQAMHF